MKIPELKDSDNEGALGLDSRARRAFLLCGLKVTGIFLGGSILSLVAVSEAVSGVEGIGAVGTFPYKPHYSMIIWQNRCIDCERCMEACVQANAVPDYGYRIKVMSRKGQPGAAMKDPVFMPILCNQCNRPPCARVCPTRATYKDKKTGIVLMNDSLCIGCRACMTACPYNARYINEVRRAADKCDFCYKARLASAKGVPACVETCPAGALVFGDLADSSSEVHQLVYLSKKTVWVLRPELGTLPNVFYIKE
ncbi:MAG: twin-arginine translocation pathway signal protein [Deltaproteobacteria bacterium RIFOXYD12_FULL_57_12]|nr:MAG: twin-arginine translocation pathway signal protein [Deltaproteobacteria bacterium RIFOXYD12_FULL_57_12]